MIITNDYGSFPHSLPSTSKLRVGLHFWILILSLPCWSFLLIVTPLLFLPILTHSASMTWIVHSNKTSHGCLCVVFLWFSADMCFSKIGVPPNHPELDHFSIETYGDLRYHHFRNPPYGGWLRNPASVDRWFIHVYTIIYRFSTIQPWWQGGAGFRNHHPLVDLQHPPRMTSSCWAFRSACRAWRIWWSARTRWPFGRAEAVTGADGWMLQVGF